MMHRPFGIGEPDRVRTCDLLIKSQLLYQLSYGPTFQWFRGASPGNAADHRAIIPDRQAKVS